MTNPVSNPLNNNTALESWTVFIPRGYWNEGVFAYWSNERSNKDIPVLVTEANVVVSSSDPWVEPDDPADNYWTLSLTDDHGGAVKLPLTAPQHGIHFAENGVDTPIASRVTVFPGGYAQQVQIFDRLSAQFKLSQDVLTKGIKFPNIIGWLSSYQLGTGFDYGSGIADNNPLRAGQIVSPYPGFPEDYPNPNGQGGLYSGNQGRFRVREVATGDWILGDKGSWLSFDLGQGSIQPGGTGGFGAVVPDEAGDSSAGISALFHADVLYEMQISSKLFIQADSTNFPSSKYRTDPIIQNPLNATDPNALVWARLAFSRGANVSRTSPSNVTIDGGITFDISNSPLDEYKDGSGHEVANYTTYDSDGLFDSGMAFLGIGGLGILTGDIKLQMDKTGTPPTPGNMNYRAVFGVNDSSGGGAGDVGNLQGTHKTARVSFERTGNS